MKLYVTNGLRIALCIVCCFLYINCYAALSLQNVIEQKNQEILRYLSEGGEVNVRNEFGVSLLSSAARVSDKNTIKTLLERGANPNVVDLNGTTPLMMAIRRFKDEDLTRLFLSKGANVNAKDKTGNTALMDAAERPQLVKLLIDAGADVSVTTNEGNPALFFASNVEVVQLLVNAGANVNVKNNAGENAFVYQMLYNRPEVVSFLVKNGVDIRVKNKYGESALIQAISHEKNNVEPDFKITRELLNLGEDVNAKNLRGEAPIAIVAGDDTYGEEDKRLEIVKLLLEKGAIINARTNEGVTALMAAAIHGNTNTVKFLLDNGANPNIADREEFTPLMAACWHMGNIDTVRLLLKNGADANVKDVTGKSAIDYAKKFERKDILDLLVSSRSVN